MTVMSVQGHLAERGVEAEVLRHEPTHTARGEAVQLGVPADEVVKTIVLDTKEGHALAVIPASERLDMGLVHQATGDGHAALASEEELRRDFPDCELGTFPPLGSLLDAPVYVDPHVMHHDTVVFAAAQADTSLRVRTQDLFRDDDTTVVPLIREMDDKEREFFG